MRLPKILTIAALVAACVAVPRAQSLMTLQPSQVAGITNTTTTRNSNIPIGIPYVSADILLNITAGGTATGTLQIFLQDSVDNGTTWSDLCASNTFAFGAAATTQRFRIYASSEGPGLLRSITGTTPSAGAEVSETVPAGARWELIGLRATLTTSVAAANRIPDFVLDDGANIYWRAPQGTAQVASLALGYQVSQGLTGNFSDSFTTFFQSIPTGIRLGPGHRIRTITSAIQGADQWTAPQYLVREWRTLGFGEAQVAESFPAGQCRSGPMGNRLRVREAVSGIGGSPVGPTYTITAVFGS